MLVFDVVLWFSKSLVSYTIQLLVFSTYRLKVEALRMRFMNHSWNRLLMCGLYFFEFYFFFSFFPNAGKVTVATAETVFRKLNPESTTVANVLAVILDMYPNRSQVC